jgi:hypothetical protein
MNANKPTRRMADLIETLFAQTKAHAIDWKRTDFPKSYAYPARSGSVIVRGPGGMWDDDLRATTAYSIEILNAVGDKVESFEEPNPAALSFPQLKALVDEIIRQYEEGDPLLDSLRHEAMAAHSGI